ncbi:ABC transporter ATP-binding protein [Acidisoma cellulosilytica]|uniref:ABC transporter ATP-binding protein n=1 Tax=Acidisoma cellulosilyticum TaxID=2802395 RepID=A0A964E4C4_9PROT|nr:ABC transporter ATP-binding protein [Acidisoma cellulosilyticum]MCB8881147.1 ABC transporter ATP-binding protein [Acidisoma cellulosilyticum]
MTTAIMEAVRLVKRYPTGGGMLHAVDAVDLAIQPGESVGLVGESGCGKSTLVRLLGRLIEPTEGAIVFEGQDIAPLPLRRFVHDKARGRIQVVFQDPTESLNPSLTVFDTVADPIRRLGNPGGRQSLAAQVRKAIALVGLPPEMETRLPHQLSGGQRARVGIARAIALRPSLLILDEPTSALDVSVQAVILRLLADLRSELGMSYLFVSHDLNVVRLLCSRIVVMYLGKVVEEGPTEAMFRQPRHPYTRALLASIPDPARRGHTPWRLEGSASSPIDPSPTVCRFYGRCPRQEDRCAETMPELRAVGSDGVHRAACHFAEEISA